MSVLASTKQAQEHGIRLEVIRHTEAKKGFILPVAG